MMRSLARGTPRAAPQRRRVCTPRCAAAGEAHAPPPRPEIARLAAAVLVPLLADSTRDPAAAVKAALRSGSGGARGDAQSQMALSNDDRAALGGLVFGVCVLRARLAHQARHAAAALRAQGGDAAACAALDAAAAACDDEPAAAHARSDADAAAAVLAALYLLHDSPPACAAAASSAAAALGVPPAALAAARAAAPAALTWPSDAAAALAARRSLPRWLASEWVAQLGAAHADALAAALGAPGPVTLRVNALRCDHPSELASALATVGVATLPGRHARAALRLPAGRPRAGVWSLPRWREGAFEVQDEGSQLVARAVRAAPEDVVLDLCAGAGGKALALASEMRGAGTVLAYDVARERLAACAASARRAGAEACITLCGDASGGGGGGTELLAACASAPLDAVLVDAPCSGTGALRRRPGARWALARGDALDAAPATQRALLSLAAALARASPRPSPRIVYATCSLLRQENEDVARWFESTFGADFEPWPFDDDDDALVACVDLASAPPLPPLPALLPHERALLPHVHGTDGFYIARWRRRVRADA
jgi:16S rRNA (cytosine967-C5)-methyltransferase